MADQSENHAQQGSGDLSSTDARNARIREIRERAVEREEEIYEAFKTFKAAHWPAPLDKQAKLNRVLLLTAMEGYFGDIFRKKDEHHISFADCHKRAAFTVKWLLRLRPIQFQQTQIHPDLALANEEFALFIACGFLEIDPSELPVSLAEHILHYYRNQSYDAESWACTFYMIEACGKMKLFDTIVEYFEEKKKQIAIP